MANSLENERLSPLLVPFTTDWLSFMTAEQGMIGILAILTILCSHVANGALVKYILFPDEGTSWVEKGYIITLFMILMSLITLVEWDVLFIDSRDYSNLSILPVKKRTLFAAKFTSLLLFVGIFAIGMNALSSLVFVYYLPHWQSSSLVFALKFLLVHLVSVFAACLFMFFLFIFLIGILLTILGTRLFTKISVYLRSAFLIIFIFFLILILIESLGVSNFSNILEMKDSGSSFLSYFPPMWFVGLYESLLGTQDILFQRGKILAIIVLVATIFSFFLVSLVGHKNFLKSHAPPKKTKVFFFKIKTALWRGFERVFFWNPIQMAVFHFFRKTIRKSMAHKMRLANFLSISISLSLILLASNWSRDFDLTYMNSLMLSFPFIVSFFLLLGLRSVVQLPISLEANWIFRLTEEQRINHYFIGLKKSIVFYLLIPLILLSFFCYTLIWNWQHALFHSLFVFSISLLLMEIFFIHNRKIPFTCSYLPGKEKMHFLWIVYMTAFLAYVYLFIWLDKELFENITGYSIFYGIIILILISIRLYQKLFYYKKTRIKFEEEPEPAMIVLFNS